MNVSVHRYVEWGAPAKPADFITIYQVPGARYGRRRENFKLQFSNLRTADKRERSPYITFCYIIFISLPAGE